MANSFFMVSVRDDNWVVLEEYGTVERIVFVAASEEEADAKCREFNSDVEFPIAV